MPESKHIVERPIGSLKPYRQNARIHSAKQIAQIAESIETFGFTNPVLVDEQNRILAGHGRVEAAKQLGWTNVPTLQIAHLSEAEKRAYILADNKLAENAGWDADLLRIELGALAELDLDFDLTVTGFEAPEIDVILGSADEYDGAEDPPLDEPPAKAISQPGDRWLLGKHRLLCGDATDTDAYIRLLDGAQADMVFTDPPYNLPIPGHVSGLGRICHGNFAMASGEMSREAYSAFLECVLKRTADHSVDGSLHYIFIDWRHVRELLAAAEHAYDETKALCVWTKTNAGMGSLYRSQHELIFVFKRGRSAHTNNVLLGKHGRNRSNVWSYPGANTFRAGRLEELSQHPTPKPVGLAADAILDASQRGGLVLDPFIGSGTTLLAAERTGRVAYGMEIDPRYVDVTLRRWEKATGNAACHADTDLTFHEMAQRRSRDRATAEPKMHEENTDARGP